MASPPVPSQMGRDRKAPDRNVARVPLFDRLVDTALDQTWEEPPRRTLDRAGLRESVIREVTRLLNTRCPLPADRLRGTPRHCLNYGLPDLSHFSPGAPPSEEELSELLVRTVAAFEPRLTDLRIRIEEIGRDRNRMTLAIHGNLLVGSQREPLSFVVATMTAGEEQAGDRADGAAAPAMEGGDG